MKTLFSAQEKKYLSQQIDKSEDDLQQFICDNWNELFPQFTFITQEFVLEGAVHGSGKSGRIDILAYNPVTKRFVFFELKKDYDKNIGHQAVNYRHYIKKNFLNVYLDALQKYKSALPDKNLVNDKEIEMILIAKRITPTLIDHAATESLITLIEYNWFENDLVLFDYVHDSTQIAKPPKPKGASTKTENVYEKWKLIISSMPNVETTPWKKQIHDIPFAKENIADLRNAIEKGTKTFKEQRGARLLKLLKQLEEQIETE